MNNISEYKTLLYTFNKLPKNIQKLLIKNINKEFVKVLCEICLNLTEGNIVLTNENKNKIKHKNFIIKALADKKKSLAKKTKYLRQRGGFIIPLLTGIIGPVLANLVTNNA